MNGIATPKQPLALLLDTYELADHCDAWLRKRALPRDVLVEMFWGDQDEARARHSLDNALSHFRRVLGTNPQGYRRAFQTPEAVS